MKKNLKGLLISSILLLIMTMLSACSKTQEPYNYTNFKQHHPKSILILPPINASAEIKATTAVYSSSTFPLAESGYYVLPISLVYETFRQNGLHIADEIHKVSHKKLLEIFQADAVLYINIIEYGTSYNILSSDTTVTLQGRLVDLRTSKLLWEGKSKASTKEQQHNNQGGIIGLLVEALIKQIIHDSFDTSQKYANIANIRLLSTNQKDGQILYGHRSPKYKRY